MAKPVTVWATADEDGAFCMFGMEPVKNGDGTYGGMMLGRMDINLGLGDCREYVLVPASEHKPTAELSPVAKLIAEIASSLLVNNFPIADASPIPLATAIVRDAISAARKIEGKADA